MALSVLVAAPRARAATPIDPVAPCGRGDGGRVIDTTLPDTARHATILGTVRSDVFGSAIPGARLDVQEMDATVCSDSTGGYRLPDLPGGTVTLRATRAGYEPLVLTVTLPDRGSLWVDLTMTPKLVVLDSVRVSASRSVAAAGAPAHGSASDDDEGAWGWRGDPSASSASTGEPDLVRTLSSDPHLALRPDWPGSLMDRGGSSDQLLVRVDGLPVWSPTHGGGTLSDVSPDAIASFDLHDGAMGAAYGDRLGGVVDITTREPPTSGWMGAASVGPSALRATWGEPLTVGDATGGLLVAVRRSNDDLPQLANDAGPIADRWADGVVAADITSGATTLKAIGIASGDRAAPLGNGIVTDALSPAIVPWNTATAGLVWTQALGSSAQLQSHLSTSRFVATVPGASDSAGATLGDGIRQNELATQLAWHRLTTGVAVDALDVSYRVTPASFMSAAPSLRALSAATSVGQPLALSADPTTLSTFIEQRWGPGGADSAWHVTTGLRTITLAGTTTRLEPRADAAVRVLPGIVVTLGYARTHQVVQSLRNTESAVGAELGVDLPVAAGSGGVPLAQSDVGTVGVIVRAGPLGLVSVDGYVRALSGLVVADPLASSIFAVTGFDRATAHVSGLAAQLHGGAGPVTWQAGYGMGSTVESTDGMRYHPTSELGQTASMATGFSLDRLTQVRFAGWAGYGQPAPGLELRSDATSSALGTGAASAAAPPVSWIVTPRLPLYLRADLQVAHEWQTGPGPSRVSTYLTVANVFNHANVAEVLPTGPAGTTAPAGTLRAVTLLPRTLLLGLGWVY